MPWILLIIAGVLEIAWAVALKQSDGFSKLLPSIICFVCASGSFSFLSMALKSIPIGTAYAVWTGIGAVGVAIIGIVWFNESANALRLLFIGFIILGILGLKFLSN